MFREFRVMGGTTVARQILLTSFLATIKIAVMLRSILKDREDGPMIGLLGVAMTITLFKDLEFFVDYQTLALRSFCVRRSATLPTGQRRSI